MHRSRLGGLIIDCRTEDLEAAAEFWSQALGCRMVRSIDPADANYVQLETAPNEPHLEVQNVDHESRVHIDIETDDIEAEAARLEKTRRQTPREDSHLAGHGSTNWTEVLPRKAAARHVRDRRQHLGLVCCRSDDILAFPSDEIPSTRERKSLLKHALQLPG